MKFKKVVNTVQKICREHYSNTLGCNEDCPLYNYNTPGLKSLESDFECTFRNACEHYDTNIRKGYQKHVESIVKTYLKDKKKQKGEK
jgi:hypothetical protein